MTEPKIINLGGRELHLFGSTAVCWNLRLVKKEIKGEIKDDNGQPYPVTTTVSVPERCSRPYIDFVDIRERNGEFWEDEDSPVAGGFTIDFARELVSELQQAIAYMEAAENRS